MESIRQYILSVTAAGLLCAIAKALCPDRGALSGLLKLICGVFLTFVLLSPGKNMDFSEISQYWMDFSQSGESIAREGEQISQEAMADIIKSQSEAYILDKAQTLREDVEVEVGLDDALTPASAVLTGDISPYGRSVLSDWMEQTLGISKEAQTWSG